MLHFRSKVVSDPGRISVKDHAGGWTLLIKKVQTNGGRTTMFLLHPVQTRFIQLSSSVVCDEVKPPIWLNPQEFSVLVKALQKLEGKSEEGQEGS
jgi:hypothetical protein